MTEQQLKDLLADMSLEEKIGQMVQLTANFWNGYAHYRSDGKRKNRARGYEALRNNSRNKWCSKVKGDSGQCNGHAATSHSNAVYA